MLALVDTFHLMSSALTFSIANLSPAYSSHAWYYIVPYSLPIAQVCYLVSIVFGSVRSSRSLLICVCPSLLPSMSLPLALF